MFIRTLNVKHMEKVKLFLDYLESDEDVKKFEGKINKWIQKKENIQITQRFQTREDEGTLITIFYKEGLAL